MRITTFILNLCSVFIFLTLGSLLTIVSLHLVEYKDIAKAVELAYGDPWRMFQIGALGLLMLLLGLAFAKTLIKSDDDQLLVYESKDGEIRMTIEAISEFVRKFLKKYTVVKEQKTKVDIDKKQVDIHVRLVLWSTVEIPDFVRTLQDELRTGVTKLLGPECRINVRMDVARVLSHDPEVVVK